MNFVDKASVTVVAGNGGNGRMSFRREKFVARGGPDGGDGGDGGSVVFVASPNEDTLASFRYNRELKAESGESGGKRRMHGKSGLDLLVSVPAGTVVLDETGRVLADLVTSGEQTIIAKGGKGGFGNAHFTSSTRQAPRIAELGEPGEKLKVSLELKMIADVGLVGLPNAGKSTLLSVLSNARPEIADYPFTTVTPNLGVVDIDKNHSLLIADIPGLIEGAAEGKGLGDEFLRHIERTVAIVHLIDAYQDNIVNAYKTIQTELKSYKIDLSKRPQIVAINKTEGLDKDMVYDLTKQLQKVVAPKTKVMAISAKGQLGLKVLVHELQKITDNEHQKQAERVKNKDQLPVLRLAEDGRAWHVKKVSKGFEVSGQQIERFALRTDFKNEAAVQRLRDIMKKQGIMHELERQNAQSGDKIKIGSIGKLEF